jgi:thiosulfate/3-mercaptopyruvate sulfurtransferase
LYTTLITTEEAAQNLENEKFVFIDCRFDLAKPGWGFETYQQSHIPGAVYADLNKDLSSPITLNSGRHPLPEWQVFVEKLSAWGIDPDTQVVVYDTTGGSFADRLWFMLRLVGHPAAAVLNGGFGKWITETRPTESGEQIRKPTKYPFPGDIHTELLVSAEDVNELRNNPEFVIIDARAPERYRGELEPIDRIAGHIPGAVNRFHGLNLAPDGTLKSPDQLKTEYRALLGPVPPEKAIVYCGSGVTSCHHLLALQSIGFEGTRIYLGSWSEWIRDPDRPIAKG